ncbi:Fic family protein [Mycoplasmopsis adleri]|uniref:Fic family protein n=1 Tax=Mycoplasmopsis adleri TaxID=51362 RepID=UPI003872C03C
MKTSIIVKYIYELTTYAANLENVNITVKQTKRMINDLSALPLSQYEQYIVLNLYDVYKQIANEEIQYNKKNPLITLMNINKVIGNQIIYQNGTLRQGHVEITGTSYTPKPVSYEEVNNLILNTLYEMNEDNILLLHCKLMKIQPFNDGNKRSTMVFSNLLLNKYFNKILLIKNKDIDKYRDLFIEYYETDDNKQFIKFLKQRLISHSNKM